MNYYHIKEKMCSFAQKKNIPYEWRDTDHALALKTFSESRKNILITARTTTFGDTSITWESCPLEMDAGLFRNNISLVINSGKIDLLLLSQIGYGVALDYLAKRYPYSKKVDCQLARITAISRDKPLLLKHLDRYECLYNELSNATAEIFSFNSLLSSRDFQTYIAFRGSTDFEKIIEIGLSFHANEEAKAGANSIKI